MKILKYLLFIVLGLVAIISILGLIAPNDYSAERQVTINKSNDQVFEYLKSLKNQDNWSVWAKMDPNMKKDFKGIDGTVGCIASWDSENENVGQGEQEIKAITEGSRVDMELRFKKPFESTSQAYLITETTGENQTMVKWGFKGSMPFPMNTMLLFMNMDEAIGKDFETGLSNLKTILEQ